MARFCVVARDWQGKTKDMQCNKEPLSFAEIVKGRDASVRVFEDGLVDVVDLVMVVTAKDCNHSNACLRSLDNSLFDNQKVVMHNGRKYVTLKDAITLIMVLPGKMAKELRSQFAEIIEKYIRTNLGLSEVVSVEEPLTGFKRRREELELFKLEEEVRGMTQARLKNEEEVKGMTQTRILAATAEIERIRDPSRSNLDERTRLMIQDTMQNSILNSQAPALGGGGALSITNGPSPNALISISSVAAKLGYKPDTEGSKRIGMDLRKRYLKQHGKAPPKHDQMCDGRVTLVNSYTEQDRALVEEALHTFFAAAKK